MFPTPSPSASRRTSDVAPRAMPPALSAEQVEAANRDLADASPEEILRWAINTVPDLYQTTSFGLTGSVALDMISRLAPSGAGKEREMRIPPLIFIDTLYHFPETLALAQESSAHYLVPLHTFRPQSASSSAQFEALYGPELWRREPESYDWLVKVEPARRAYEELGVRAVLTGRRRSQGADRASLAIVEVDETGLVKINPLANWSFGQVNAYAKAHRVPYNPLLDRGYKSIGDWHSTKASEPTPPSSSSSSGSSSDGESTHASSASTTSSATASRDGDERAGRWSGQEKTECGLHENYFAKRRAFLKRQREAQMAVRDAARDSEAGEADATA